MRMSKRSIYLLVAVLSANLFLPSTQALELPKSFAFSGSGYGHGVGMSQIGARAKAIAGESATAILQYYYSGTSIETISDTQTLRINIGHLLTSARFRSDSKDSELHLFSGDLSESQTASPILIIPSKTALILSLTSNSIQLSTKRGTRILAVTTGDQFTLRWTGTRLVAGPTTVVSFTAASKTNKFAHGQMSIKLIKDKVLGKRIEVVNSVRLQDEYLWGVSEVPSTWPSAALEAQAIASRTYAIAKSFRVRSACDCHLYGSISDQSFVGYSKESEPRFGELWKAAVSRTAGQIITFAGAPITAYFGSSTGGQTQTSQDVWGGATPYTVSVPDSASVDISLNPRFAFWIREVTQSVLARSFILPDVVALEVLSFNPAGSVALIRATASNGASSSLTGETFRSRSKLPSAWFSISSSTN